MARVRFQRGRRRPDVHACIRDLLDDRVERDDVRAGPAQQHERDGAGGRRVPGYGVGGADGDDFGEARFGNGVAGGVADWGGVGRGEAEEGGRDEEGEG